MNYVILKELLLSENHKSTFKTIHKSYGETIGRPHKLQIVKYPEDGGVYLIYLNDKGEELTDTFHSNIEEAMDQAKWEFEVQEKDWQSL